MTGVADAQTDAAILGPDVLVDRAQAIVARVAAALFDAQLAGGKVQFVVKDDDVLRFQLVIAHRLADGLAGQVHEGLGL